MENKKKNLILDAAKSRFDRYGFKKTTIDEICGSAKISKKTVYDFFKGKEDILVSLFIREAFSARKAVLSKIDNVIDPKEKIDKLLRVARGYFGEGQFMVKILKDDKGLYAPFLHQKYYELVENGILNIISDILKQGIRKGEFRKLDPKIGSYIIFKLFQAFTYAATSQVKNQVEKDKVMDELLDFIFKGIGRQ